jgi:23S rRNA (guanosine2251-2'-O)-methyltransferase
MAHPELPLVGGWHFHRVHDAVAESCLRSLQRSITKSSCFVECYNGCVTRITLLLHNIRSTHNVGAIFRTAEGFGIEKIILSGYTPYPALDDDARLPHIRDKLSQQIHKTALGAETMVPFEYHPHLDTWIERNRSCDNPLPIVALEQSENAIMLPHFAPPDSCAVLLGEEVRGVEARYLAMCEAIVEIPMSGRKESFNVSVAAGIALYAMTAGQLATITAR